MSEFLKKNRERIAALCAGRGVVRLEAFGSVLRPEFRPGERDIDLLVEFRPIDDRVRIDAYFGLLDDLRSLLGTSVDLVMVSALTNPYIATEIDRTKQLLYAA